MTPEQILEKVIYRDALMLVLNKPAGVPVHKGKGAVMENVDDWCQHLRYGLPRNPALAHRLDKETSGCLVLGRHRKALAKLGQMFKRGDIKKTYLAIVDGAPPEMQGVINAPIGKLNDDPKNWHMKVREDGQEAITEYKVLEQKNGCSLLELKPLTGRTHQLRVHCKHIGCPIVGDYIYGTPQAGQAMLLHAYSVEIPIYKNREEPVVVTVEPPSYFTEFQAPESSSKL